METKLNLICMKHQFLRKLLVLSAAILLSYFTFSQTVTLCSQVWDVKNLDVSTYRNGDPIPQVTDPTAWASLTTGAWCYYANDPANGTTYGKLYNWYAVNDPRGLAPAGWHVPSDAEWSTLETCLGGALAAGAMKEAGNVHWTSPNTGATNSSGFTALPGGTRNSNGTFGFAVGNYGFWWTSTSPWNRDMAFNNADVTRNTYGSGFGFSVRCLRDACTPPAFSACPSNQAANTASSSCTAIVSYTATASGNPAPGITYSFAGATSGSGTGNGSGSTFSKGTTTVTLTATNSCGTATCSFNVVVTDITPPTITCSGPVIINTTQVYAPVQLH